MNNFVKLIRTKFRLRVSLLVYLTVTSMFVIGQVPTNQDVFFAKEYSKEIALYKAKEFAIKNILGETYDPVKFEIDPLAAAYSGELTCLTYFCKKKNLEGLIFGFYNDTWNNSGVVYSAYAFKNITRPSAQILLSKIDSLISESTEYLGFNTDYNNLYFHYDDLIFLLYKNTSGSTKIRVFWNNFDSEWDWTAFKRTQKRFFKK